MPLPPDLFSSEAHWLDEPADCNNVVVTTRARYARNLTGRPFAPHGGEHDHEQVLAAAASAMERSPYFTDYFRLDLSNTTPVERAFLKERRLISKELERGGSHRSVFLTPSMQTSLMVNEEDHLRIQCLEPGLRLSAAHRRLDELDGELAGVLDFAWHERFGFLTACPTNVGTGLRASVMLHLPALSMRRKVQEAFSANSERGLTLRGFYGENTEPTGDYYQLSNEVTLGVSVAEIFDRLSVAVGTVMQRELEARSLLLKQEGVAIRDHVWRSYGILRYAQRITSAEAMTMLSRLRLGMDEGCFPGFSHVRLNRLVMEIQPGHLVYRHGGSEETDARDAARARLIQRYLPAI